MKIAYHTEYKLHLPSGHRFPMDKYELLPEQLIYEGTCVNSDFFIPEALLDDDVLTIHTNTYLLKLLGLSLSKKEIRKVGFPLTVDLVRRGRHISMGTYQSALHAINDGISLNIAGGTHHAYSDHGEGFCMFNDIAIASNLLLKRKQVEKILIVDLDVHQGNGTASIFLEEQRVFTFSMHGAKNYPLEKEKSDLDIGWRDGTEGKEYLNILSRSISKLLIAEDPDIVFYQAGVDVLKQDKLGRLALSIDDCKERDRIVMVACAEANIPIAVSMGGGYAPLIKDIIEAHANTFRVASDIFSFN